MNETSLQSNPPPLTEPTRVLTPVKNRSWIKIILLSLGIFLIIIISLYFTIAYPLMVAGNPIPPLKHGEYVLVNKLQYNFTSPQEGDRIQFKSPSGQTFIGIIIEISGNKDIYETVSTPTGGRYLLKKEDILGKIYFPFISNTDSLSQTIANIATPTPIPSISPPIISDPADPNDNICASDSDCEIYTCGCNARKKDPSNPPNVCARACEEAPVCINNQCEVKK